MYTHLLMKSTQEPKRAGKRYRPPFTAEQTEVSDKETRGLAQVHAYVGDGASKAPLLLYPGIALGRSQFRLERPSMTEEKTSCLHTSSVAKGVILFAPTSQGAYETTQTR